MKNEYNDIVYSSAVTYNVVCVATTTVISVPTTPTPVYWAAKQPGATAYFVPYTPVNSQALCPI